MGNIEHCARCNGRGTLGGATQSAIVEPHYCPVCGGTGWQPLALLAAYQGAVEALDEAIQAARLFNRNGMTWLEYDRKLVELEQVVNRARGR